MRGDKNVANAQSKRPNVIVFFTDQQRWDTTGSHGNPLEGQIRQLVSIVDLPPTLLDAAGLSIPDVMQGRSILPLL